MTSRLLILQFVVIIKRCKGCMYLYYAHLMQWRRHVFGSSWKITLCGDVVMDLVNRTYLNRAWYILVFIAESRVS